MILLQEPPAADVAAGWPFFGQLIAHDITANRYGHSQVGHRYQINADNPPLPLFPDLIGFDPVPAARAVDGGYFFEVPGCAPALRAKKIDGRLAPGAGRRTHRWRCSDHADQPRSRAFRATDPDWTPPLPTQRAGRFGLAGLNVFAIASA